MINFSRLTPIMLFICFSYDFFMFFKRHRSLHSSSFIKDHTNRNSEKFDLTFFWKWSERCHSQCGFHMCPKSFCPWSISPILWAYWPFFGLKDLKTTVILPRLNIKTKKNWSAYPLELIESIHSIVFST